MCYAKNGSLYHVEAKAIGKDAKGRTLYKRIWRQLGSLTDLPACYKKLSTILAGNDPVNTIQQLWEKYEREELHKKAAKTQTGRRNDMKWPLTVFGAMPAAAIESHHIWTYWRDRGETEQARHEIRALSVLLTYAGQCGARKTITDNPCFDLKLPGAPARTLYVTDAMFYAVHDVAPPMMQYAMQLAWCAGIDEGTVRRLERRNITPTGIEFERGKTKKLQAVDGEDLVAIVKAALSVSPQVRRFVICQANGKQLSADGFQSAWQRAMTKAIELKRLEARDRYHFHDLRAKAASEKESDKEAQDLLGHGDKKVTVRHYRRLPQRGTAVKIFKEKA